MSKICTFCGHEGSCDEEQEYIEDFNICFTCDEIRFDELTND